MLALRIHGLVHQRMKTVIEVLHHTGPFFLTFRYFIKLFFNICGEIIIHNFRKEWHQKVINHNTYISRQQLRLLIPGRFRLDGFGYLISFQFQYFIRTFYAFTVSFYHVATLLDCRYSRSICRRTTDSQFLQLTHQTGFGIARRTHTETLSSRNFFIFQWLSLAQRRQ